MKSIVSTLRAGMYPALACMLSTPAVADETITIDASQRYQQIEGWGTCMIFWSLGNTPYWDQRWREAYRDAGFNILRVDMQKEVLTHSANDWATPVELVDDLQTNVDRMDFARDDVSVYGDMAQWLAENALEPERVRITGSLWTPPHWMKGPTGFEQSHVNNSTANPTPWLSNGTTGDSIGGRLIQTPENLEQFGRHVTAWVEGFEQEYGVPMYSISIQNEMTFENPFDSCTYLLNEDGDGSQWWQYASALRAVQEEMADKDVEVKLMGPHVAGLGDTNTNPHRLWQQMGFINELRKPENSDVFAELDFFASNGYIGTSEGAVRNQAAYWSGADSVTDDWGWWGSASQDVYGVQSDGKPTWYCEAGGDSGGWPSAITVSQKIYNALVHANVSAYVYWQMSDGGSNVNDHTLLGSSHLDDPHSSKKYCAFKHFSRYIRPGARRVSATFDTGNASIGGASQYDTQTSLNVAAFVHDTDQTATIVLINRTGAQETLEIAVPTAPAVSEYQVFRTKSDENFAELTPATVNSGNVTITVPAESVVTLYGEGQLESGDPDQDGIDSLLEVFFGMNPNQADREGYAVDISRSEESWTLAYPRAKNTQNVNATLEWSSDLSTWQTSGIGTPVVTDDSSDPERLEVNLPDPGDDPLFVRFSASETE